MESETMKDDGKGPILHVIVVGFHHKKGCQVEYSFPPLVDGAEPDSNACPAGWKYLPTLALPDGSHNFDEDTVYFHLPSLTDSKETVYGISCFRQIPVEKLKNRTADITRGTVQKSVCALSTLPLYGHIQVKMALITHAYFEEGDFSQVKLLQDTFYHLNSCLSEVDPLQFTPQLYVGLSVRDFILQFRHKTLLLFKLLLLERRLVFYRSPVQPLCSSILSLLSLHPGMLENGLRESACVKPSRPMSPVPDYDDSSVEIVLERPLENVCDTNITSEEENYKNELNELRQSIDCTPHISDIDSKEKQDNNISDNTISISQINYGNDDKNKLLDENIKNDTDSSGFESSPISNSESVSENVDCNVSIYEHQPDMMDNKVQEDMIPSSDSQNDDKWMEVCTPCDNKLKTSDSGNSLSISNATRSSQNLHRDTSTDTICDSTSVQSNMNSIAQIPTEQCGLPLPIFTLGYLCHPYLSLPYLDLLSDINVRGYVVGATNVLFKQKKQLADVLIEVEGCKVETQDPELRRQLHLTTEDLRFADFVVRHVAEERHDVFLDGVGWEGGDEWIRAQFRVYLLCLLRTSLLQDGSRELEHFNSNFISAWKSTHNYKMWVSGENKGIWEVNPGHPFAGQLSVADMKLRLSHTMQNTEGGRKLNQAMVSTGRAVATTGRAVGGAISHAKGALSNWWSTLTTAQSPENGTSRAENDTDVTEATEAEEAVEDSETEDPEPKRQKLEVDT